MVSGSFFLNVSALKIIEIAAKITDAPNNSAGSEWIVLPCNQQKSIKSF